MASHRNQLWAFVEALPSPEKELPFDLLQRGLEDPNPETRETVLRLISTSKATVLRPAVEKLLIHDRKESVRVIAADVLADLKCRESLPVLRSAFRGSEEARVEIASALARLGGDAEVQLIAPLLSSKSASHRSAVAYAISEMHLNNRDVARTALLPLLEDPSEEVKIAVIKGLATWKEPSVVPAIQEILRNKNALGHSERRDLIHALEAIGNEAAVSVLNGLDLADSDVSDALLRLSHPSSAYAYWDAYLCDPVRVEGGEDPSAAGNFSALRMLARLADPEIFRALRLHIATHVSHPGLLEFFEREIEELTKRFPDVAAEPIASLKSNAPSKPSDRDGDGVPDRKDKYPDDDRRSEDIPFANLQSDVQVEMRHYAIIPLAEAGPAAKTPLFMALGDDSRTGWITAANETDPPDYHVASSNHVEVEEWPLPNPGNTPGVYRLVPSGVTPEGTVVGTAIRKKVRVPRRQDIHEPHITYQSGFIFERGKLRFDPPAPFMGKALNVEYRSITHGGLIFGHREIHVREWDQDSYRRVSFLGDRLFTEVPAFEAISVNDSGQLLGYRTVENKHECFIWDGERFQSLGSLAGKPEEVRAYAMNQKLQVVGRSDALDKDRCPTGFFWEKGVMRPFEELLPKEFRSQVRSAIPYLINDPGTIVFRAERKAGPFPQTWPKEDFLLNLRENGENEVQLVNFTGGTETE